MAQHQGGKGNFAEDPKRASEAGKKGGQASGGNFKNAAGLRGWQERWPAQPRRELITAQ